MDQRKLIGNILFWLFVLAALTFLGFLFYTDRQEQQEQIAIMEDLNERALPYQEEKRTLQRELENLENNATYQSAAAKFMMGFLVSSVDDFPYIREQAGMYGFSPVIVFDCHKDPEELQSLLTMTDETWEIMLYAPSFGGDVSDKIQAFKAYLSKIGRKDIGVCFVRKGYMTAANIQLLLDNGFVGYTEYQDSPSAGQKPTGAVYFDYSYIWTNEAAVDSRLSSAYANRAAMLFVFDMEKMRAGAVTKPAAKTILRKVQSYAMMEHGTFATVDSVVTELSSINDFVAGNKAANERRIGEIQKRIDELDSIIHSIYAERTR